MEGECEDAGPLEAAERFGFSKQRYFQVRAAFQRLGAIGLRSQKRGPKTNYRRTDEVVRQVIRHRFLDDGNSRRWPITWMITLLSLISSHLTSSFEPLGKRTSASSPA